MNYVKKICVIAMNGFALSIAHANVVASLSVGPNWNLGIDKRTLILTPSIVKTYTYDKSNQTLVNGELFLGSQFCLANVMTQVGIAIATISPTNLSGDIWDDALPQFDNYVYQYKLHHSHIAVKAKLLGDTYYSVLPWFSASIGVAFNNTSHFRSQPTIEEAVPTPDFPRHTTVSFTYTIGVGLQYPVHRNWQAGIGYEFSDWGKSHLAKAHGQLTSPGLSLTHFYTNGLLVNLTYSS